MKDNRGNWIAARTKEQQSEPHGYNVIMGDTHVISTLTTIGTLGPKDSIVM